MHAGVEVGVRLRRLHVGAGGEGGVSALRPSGPQSPVGGGGGGGAETGGLAEGGTVLQPRGLRADPAGAGGGVGRVQRGHGRGQEGPAAHAAVGGGDGQEPGGHATHGGVVGVVHLRLLPSPAASPAPAAPPGDVAQRARLRVGRGSGGARHADSGELALRGEGAGRADRAGVEGGQGSLVQRGQVAGLGQPRPHHQVRGVGGGGVRHVQHAVADLLLGREGPLKGGVGGGFELLEAVVRPARAVVGDFVTLRLRVVCTHPRNEMAMLSVTGMAIALTTKGTLSNGEV